MRRFSQGENAVAPVIGVILMIAITIVIAAVIFFMVSDAGEERNEPPSFSLLTEDYTATVAKADFGAQWDVFDVIIRSDSATGTCDFDLNGVVLIDEATSTNQRVTMPSQPLTGGDVLRFTAGATPGATKCYLTIIYPIENEMMYGPEVEFTLP